MIQPLDYSRGCITQSRTTLVLRLIPDKGRSKALPLFIAMRGISDNFLVHLPSWHDELGVCKEKTNKNTLNVSKCNTFWRKLQIRKLFHFQYEDWKSSAGGDMKRNLIKGRSLESVWNVVEEFSKYLSFCSFGVQCCSRIQPPKLITRALRPCHTALAHELRINYVKIWGIRGDT